MALSTLASKPSFSRLSPLSVRLDSPVFLGFRTELSELVPGRYNVAWRPAPWPATTEIAANRTPTVPIGYWVARVELLNQLSPKKLPRFRRGYKESAHGDQL